MAVLTDSRLAGWKFSAKLGATRGLLRAIGVFGDPFTHLLIGMDVVEVAPHLDAGYSTAMNARRAVFEALTGLALNRIKISSKNYANPIVAGEVRFPMG
ncbi:hypothetical protein SALBM311S_08944 [Streptomyces alboniger]